MQQWLRPVGRALLLCATLTLSACTFSDSLLNAPVASVWPASKAIKPPTVVYVTDRALGIDSDPAAFRYGLHWDAQLHCGKAHLSVAGAWQQFGVDPPLDGSAEFRCQGDMGAVAAALDDSGGKDCKRLLLFVHGYNTTFRTALLRAGQVAADMDWNCAVAAFSWSSEAKFDRYAADIERSGYAVPELATLLRATQNARYDVNIVSHSMGTRTVLAALGSLARSCAQTGTPVVNQLILAAPDVSAEHYNDDFMHLLKNAVPCVKHVTVYASDNDMVLIASESIHGGIPRAGRVPDKDMQYPACMVPEADIVDSSLAPGDKLGHGYFALSYEMLNDIRRTLDGTAMADRLAADARSGPTLTTEPKITIDCGDDAHPRVVVKERYALLVARDRQPSWGTRFLRRLIPLVVPLQ